MRKKKILTSDDVQAGIEKISQEIMEKRPELNNLALVGILTRGPLICERIAKRIKSQKKVKPKTGVLDTRPYRDDISENLAYDKTKIGFKVDGLDVILVDDVLSSGRTMRAAMDAILKHGRPNTIRTAVLVERGHRELPISCDFLGWEIPTSSKEKIKVKLAEVDGKDEAVVVEPKKG